MQISITVWSVFQLMFLLTGEPLRDSSIEALELSSGYCERRPAYFHYRCRRLLQNGTKSSRCVVSTLSKVIFTLPPFIETCLDWRLMSAHCMHVAAMLCRLLE